MPEPIHGTAALVKGITILRVVSEQEHPPTLAELQRATGFPKGTLHRMLQALIAEGMIRQDPHQKTFQLGFGLVRLARRALADFELRDVAMDILTALRDDIGEAVHLAVPESNGVVYVEIIESVHAIGAVGKVGSSSPYHCAAAGKAIAAFDSQIAKSVLSRDLAAMTKATITAPDALESELARVRKRGFATNFEEEFPEVHGIAVPVFDARSKPTASISITIPSYRFDKTKMQFLSEKLREAAVEISNRI